MPYRVFPIPYCNPLFPILGSFSLFNSLFPILCSLSYSYLYLNWSMQSIYKANPEKIVVGMVGRTSPVIKCPREASPTSARRSTGT